MPQFAANISDGWLYSNYSFLERIEEASKAGFTAVEAAKAVEHDPQTLKEVLNKHHMVLSLMNTVTLPDYQVTIPISLHKDFEFFFLFC